MISKSNLVGRPFLAMLLITASPSVGHTQQEAGNPDDFCALSGVDLLGMLDGTWTLTNRPGTVIGTEPSMGASIVFPYPAGPPTTVTFSYDPERQLLNLRGPELEQQMVMFPTAEPQQPVANVLVGPEPTERGPNAQCDWSALPTLIGTNSVFTTTAIIDRAGSGIYVMSYFSSLVDSVARCEDPEWQKANPHVPLGDCENHKETYEAYFEDGQEPWGATTDNLELRMTLVVRFSDPNSGTGTAFFDGNMDGATAKAVTPISLSR